MKKILIILLIINFSCHYIKSQQSPGKDHSKLNISCKTCHTCNVPTKNDPV